MPAEIINSERWAAILDVPGRDKDSAERDLALFARALVQAMRQGQISVHQAWASGLNFKKFLELRDLGVDPQLLELWTWAMELPQVEKIGIEALSKSWDAIERLAESIIARHGKAVLGRAKSPTRRTAGQVRKPVGSPAKRGFRKRRTLHEK